MLIFRLRNCITTVCALLLSCFLLFILAMGRVSRFSALDGERVFYLYSASSQAVIKENIKPVELFFVKGECVTFTYQNEEECLQEILALYGGEILFEEEVAGTHSYYCRTQSFGGATRIKGAFVNLHIAFNGERCTVGTPLIFGGF